MFEGHRKWLPNLWTFNILGWFQRERYRSPVGCYRPGHNRYRPSPLHADVEIRPASSAGDITRVGDGWGYTARSVAVWCILFCSRCLVSVTSGSHFLSVGNLKSKNCKKSNFIPIHLKIEKYKKKTPRPFQLIYTLLYSFLHHVELDS
jgi:hypothetical protein